MMKRGILIIALGIFLIVFIIGGVSAEFNRYDVRNITVFDDGLFKFNQTIFGENIFGNIIINLDLFNDYPSADSVNEWAFLNTENFNNVVYLDSKEYSCLVNGYYSKDYNQWEAKKELWISLILRCLDTQNNSQDINLIYRYKRGSDWNGKYYTNITDISGNILTMNVDNKNFKSVLDNLDERINIIETWKTALTTTINSIQTLITGHTTKLDNQETRISNLENSTSNGTTIINNTTTIIVSNGTNPYLKYLSNSDRKNMVCGYAEDNHLTQLTDLGWNCTITYKTTRGRTTSTCKCKQI